MMTLLDACRRIATILALVMVVVLVSCAGSSDEGASESSSGGDERTPCSECEASCEGLSGEEKADCIEICLRDCTP